MKVRSAFFAAAAACLLMTAEADAGRGFGDMLKECGFGAMLFPDEANNALISNLLFSSPSAITSGTSSPGSCAGGDATAAIIINNSYELLEIELAAGDGDYLSMLVDVVKDEDQTQQQFASTLRTEFAEFVTQPDFSDQSRFEKAEALYEMVVK